MASISTDSSGNRRILFTDADGTRRTLYVGAMPKKLAESMRLKLEALVAAKIVGASVPDEVSRWVSGLDDALAEKLAKLGLIESRKRPGDNLTLNEFIESFIAGRMDVKPGTVMNYRMCQAKLVAYFTATKRLVDVTPLDADRFRSWLKNGTKGEGAKTELSENYTRTLVKNAKLIFGAAMKGRLIVSNPFAGHKTNVTSNRERMVFVDHETIQRVLDACPSAKWRAIVSLCRFGGLRCPSEVLSLRWDDVDFERGRMRVRSSKTEHHEGGGVREVPLFPEVRTALSELFLEPDGGELVIPMVNRDRTSNLRTTFAKIITRAKVDPWGKPFQNLRSSRETELVQTHPVHVVTAWLGNTPKVAMAHYLQVRDTDFEAATKTTRIPTQQPSADTGIGPQAAPTRNEQTPVFAGVCQPLLSHAKLRDCPTRIRTSTK